MRQHLGHYGGAGHQGSAHLQVAAATDGEHLIEGDFLANVRSNLFYFDLLAAGNAILLATGFYDRVHMKPLYVELHRTNFR